MQSKAVSEEIQRQFLESGGFNLSPDDAAISWEFVKPKKTKKRVKPMKKPVQRKLSPHYRGSKPKETQPPFNPKLYNELAKIVQGDKNRQILYELVLCPKTESQKFLVNDFIEELQSVKSEAYVTERLEVLKARIIGKDLDEIPEAPPVRMSAPARPRTDWDNRPSWDSNTKTIESSPRRARKSPTRSAKSPARSSPAPRPNRTPKIQVSPPPHQSPERQISPKIHIQRPSLQNLDDYSDTQSGRTLGSNQLVPPKSPRTIYMDLISDITAKDIDAVKASNSRASQLLSEGLVILLQCDHGLATLTSISTHTIMTEVRKVPSHLMTLSVEPSVMRELAQHLRTIPESKVTLSEKKIYDFLIQTLKFYQKRAKQSNNLKASKSHATLNPPSSKASESHFSYYSNVSQTGSGSDYHIRAPMYQRIPLYLTGDTTVRRVPRTDMFSGKSDPSMWRDNELKKQSVDSLSSINSIGNTMGRSTTTRSRERLDSPTRRFMRLRQNKQRETVLLDDVSSKNYEHFKQQVEGASRIQPNVNMESLLDELGAEDSGVVEINTILNINTGSLFN